MSAGCIAMREGRRRRAGRATRHHATLELQSQPGAGSCFRARFPAHRVLLTGASAAPEAHVQAAALEKAPSSTLQSGAYAPRTVAPFTDTAKRPAQAV